MSIILFGIANCDKVKAARRFLDERGQPYQFIDLRQQGIAPELLAHACTRLGTAKVLNKASTTFRQLSSEQQQQASSLEGALALMLAHPTLIKRPLLCAGDHLLCGFDAATYQHLLAELA